jgi:alcohol dehydrogenase
MPQSQWIDTFEFNLKTKLKTGVGEAKNIGYYLRDNGIDKIGVIVDKQAFDSSRYIQDVVNDLNNFDTSIYYYDIKGEPDYKTLDEVKKQFVHEYEDVIFPNVNCFIGIGGGSVMDFAKGLAVVTANPHKPAIAYRGFPTGIEKPLPVIVAPTTAGTGSEATYNAVFIDWDTKLKYGINTIHNFPALAVLDPLLVNKCPRNVTISTGMDGVLHSLESYMTKGANRVTKMFAREAFGLLYNNLPRVINDPDNIYYWSNLQLGSYLAGISLFNAGGGPSGAFSYSLGVHFKVPHGIAGAVFLPSIIEHNEKRGYNFADLHNLMGIEYMPEYEFATFTDDLMLLYDTLDIKCNISQFGVNKDNVQVLLDEVDGFQGAFDQNPIPFTIKDGKDLIMRMI